MSNLNLAPYGIPHEASTMSEHPIISDEDLWKFAGAPADVTSNVPVEHGELDPLGKAVTQAQETYQKQAAAPDVSPMEKRLQATGDIAAIPSAALANAIGTAGQFLGKLASDHLPKAITKAVKGEAEDIALGAAYQWGPALQKAKELYDVLPEHVRNDIGATVNIASLVPAGAAEYLTGKAVGTAVTKGLGETAENIGKQALRSGLKETKALASKQGQTAVEGAKRIVDNISKYGVESPTKGYEGIVENVQKKIAEASDNADRVVLRAQVENPDAKIDIEKAFSDFMDDVQNGKEPALAKDADKAKDLANKTFAGLERLGLTGDQPISNLPGIKSAIKKMNPDVFSKGPHHINEDPLSRQVDELIYERFKKELETAVPDVAKYNKATHDLMEIRDAVDEAAFRTGKHDMLGLKDAIVAGALTSAGGSLVGAKAIEHGLSLSGTGAAEGAGIGVGAILAGKALGHGRGASALVRGGRTLKELANPVGQITGGAAAAAMLPSQALPDWLSKKSKNLGDISNESSL